MKILLIFAAAMTVASLALAAAFVFNDQRKPTPLGALMSATATVLGLHDPLTEFAQAGASPEYVLASMAGAAFGLVAPVFLLGAFVFKLFQFDPLRWRRTLGVVNYRRHGPTLVLRFYNGLGADLVDMRFRVMARINSPQPPALLVNRRLNILAGEDLTNEALWTYAQPGVPFSLRVPLQTDLTLSQVVQSDTIQIQDPSRRAVAKQHVELMVLASGTVAGSDSPFTSIKRYRLDRDLLCGQPQDIDIDYDTAPRSWHGWENFDGVQELFVFAYGSLVTRESVQRTLGYALRREDGPHYATLRGWRRAWNVGSDARSHPERAFVRPDGSEYKGVVAYLGLVPSEHAICNGAVIRVSSRDLWVLDDRERNYYRINVTKDVTWEGKPANALVVTFVPSEAATARLTDAGEVVVRGGYIRLVERGFRELAEPDALACYRSSTPPPPWPIDEEMELRERNEMSSSEGDSPV